MKIRPTLERLHQVLALDPDSGVLRWRLDMGSRARAGAVAGASAFGRCGRIRIDGALAYTHQVVWCMHHGAWPPGLVVHLNGDVGDNRIANLGAATRSIALARTKAEAVSAANVHAIFEYRAGRLVWRSSKGGRHRAAGNEAGSLSEQGYVVVQTGRRSIAAHRIVWLMHHGDWPKGEIDHINGIRHDNRIENLRDVIRQTNAENRRKACTHSKSKALGVETLPSGKFRARIRSNGVLHELGVFDEMSAAHAAYVTAKRRLHPGNTL